MLNDILWIVTLLIGLCLLLPGGTLVCKGVLKFCKTEPLTIKKAPPDSTLSNVDEKKKEVNVGRIIGYLERGLFTIGLIAKSWELLTITVAIKTIARYKELDKQIPAEYFLVGSLTSLMWTFICWMVIGLALTKLAIIHG
jgi:hypothetical protein